MHRIGFIAHLMINENHHHARCCHLYINQLVKQRLHLVIRTGVGGGGGSLQRFVSEVSPLTSNSCGGSHIMAHKGMLNPKGTFFRLQVSERVGKSSTFWFYDSGGPCAREARASGGP